MRRTRADENAVTFVPTAATRRTVRHARYAEEGTRRTDDRGRTRRDRVREGNALKNATTDW
jgi:hypothetical protein